MVVSSGDRRHQFGLSGDIAFAHVEQHEHRLLAEEAKATDRLLLVGTEDRVADRQAGGQATMELAQDDLFALVRLTLGGRAVATGCAQPVETPLDDREVGQNELHVEVFQVPPRIDRAGRVRQGRIVEGTNDMEQGVRVTQAGEVFRGQFLGADPTCRGRRRCRQVNVRDVRLHQLLWLEDRRQPVQAIIRDFDHPDVQLEAAESPSLGVAAGECVEHGGLARPGEPDDRNLHGVDCPRTRRSPSGTARIAQGGDLDQYPIAGSTMFSNGVPVANRRRLSQNSAMLRSTTRPLDHDVCGVTMTLGRS